MKPFFSIVVPTLNEEHFIEIVLKSLEKQTYKNFEVLVVDGNSEDKTGDVVQSYKNRFEYLHFIHSPVRNLCFQRNLGGEKSHGSYLIFLDADVHPYPRYLEEIFSTINKEGSKFITTYQLPDSKSALDIAMTEAANYSLQLLALIHKQMAPGYNFIVEKELFFKAGKFDQKTTFSEDHDLSIRIGKQGVKITIIPHYLLEWSFRRIRQGGRLPIIVKYAIAAIKMIFSGKVTDKNFGYQMGGGHYDEQSRKEK